MGEADLLHARKLVLSEDHEKKSSNRSLTFVIHIRFSVLFFLPTVLMLPSFHIVGTATKGMRL